ncbi:hypothetical protein CCACVL1_12002 [Corchorus capsularis]|uniref:F-box domain-containing protein n=1 Tax=Corchorus capsularis TaxID=210143 RepID=A0A1R3II91_COCAP|nr:hypothetical protein CCACVL1_12002 [Corchorus capsularis]
MANTSRSVKASSNFALQRCNKAPTSFNGVISNELPNRIHFDVEGNLINSLPDHILVSILSLLNLKEAARTSILSCRWRNLWTFTSRLVFDDSLLSSAMREGEVKKSLEAERSRFINWVNDILKSHKGTTIDEFIVCFDVNGQSYKRDVEGWIIFALEKRVRSLHLDFSISWGQKPWGSYTLKTQFLSNYTINSLKVLRLAAVEVTGEVLEYILSMCPWLEVLSIRMSKSLVRLKVSGPSLKLKSLEILLCSLEYIEISAANLMSLKYSGDIVTAVVNGVNRLIEASISGRYASYIIKNLCHFSGLFSQLETLVLDLTEETFRTFPEFPKLRNLKNLELFLKGHRAHSLLYCAKLLKASPILQRFALKVFQLPKYCIYRKVKEQEAKQQHGCLEVIEFVGFVGCAVDIELLLYLLKGAVSLKKLIIDPSGNEFFHGKKVPHEDFDRILATSRAKKLETRLPRGAELVIL